MSTVTFHLRNMIGANRFSYHTLCGARPTAYDERAEDKSCQPHTYGPGVVHEPCPHCVAEYRRTLTDAPAPRPKMKESWCVACMDVKVTHPDNEPGLCEECQKPFDLAFKYTDGGRAAAGFRGVARDCVCRAMAIATGMSYRDCYRILSDANAATGRPRSARNGLLMNVYSPVLERFGIKEVETDYEGCNYRPTLAECYEKFGNCLVRIERHLLAIIDGVVHDQWDSRTALRDRQHISRALNVWTINRRKKAIRAPRPTVRLVPVTFAGQGRLF